MRIEDQAQILDRAAALLEGGWCQGYWARNARGETVMESDLHAVSFCLRGAVCKAIDDEMELSALSIISVERELMNMLKETLSLQGTPVFGHLDVWNDCPERTQDEVVDLCRQTALRLKAIKKEDQLHG